jgi:hypothetical protein
MTDLQSRLQAALGSAYRVERELGGGMSRVYVAEEVALARKNTPQLTAVRADHSRSRAARAAGYLDRHA